MTDIHVDFHSEVPDEQLRPRLAGLISDATKVELAVAFVTKYGAETSLLKSAKVIAQ